MVDDSIVATVNGKEISFDKAVYAEFFELPTEGHLFDLVLSSEIMEEMKTSFFADGSKIHVNGYKKTNKESITYAAQLSHLLKFLGVPVGKPAQINYARVFTASTVASTLIRVMNNLESASGASSFQTGAKKSRTVNESKASSSSMKTPNQKDTESVDSRVKQGLGVLAETPMTSLSTPSTFLRKPSRAKSPVTQFDHVAAGATESSKPEQGAVPILVTGGPNIPAPKDSLVVGKIVCRELPAELCLKPQSAIELLRARKGTRGIMISEPRPAPKPVEVVGKGKSIAFQAPEKASEARARKANFNPDAKGADVEVKVLKKLNDIIESYVSAASRYIHGADCSSAKPLNEEEAMDIPNADESDAALLIEFGTLSAEERQPEQALETNVEEVTLEDVVEEALKAPIEENEIVTHVARIEGAQEKLAEVTQPETARTEGEPSKEKDDEKEGSSSEEEQDEQPKFVKTYLFPDGVVGSVHENITTPHHYSGSLLERFERAQREIDEEEAQEKAAKNAEVIQPEQSLQKTMCQSMISREEERANFSNMFKILTELDKTLKMNTYETHVSNVKFSKFQQESFNHQSELFDIERNDNERQAFAENLARKFQSMEDALGNAEGAQPRPNQGESSRRNDGVATGTRSRRALSSDDNPRPTKRGGGRSGYERGGRNGGGRSRLSNVDQGGCGSVAERGGRSNGGGRGGRGYPHFMNMLLGIRQTDLIPQISCLLMELGVPLCPGEGLNQAQVITKEVADSFYEWFEKAWKRKNRHLNSSGN
ncbi:uncharacterized protein LOC124924597 [Impatiens glandulifera]|uniref:uncharacterized protein LOC124924597 n=1 Tax=Impatiens glandulifera TaxID=253017 RepID=UPI001FB08A92|nr:uncharacterized protein LOC124924597 [Impatiens glandulifera]